MTKEKKKKLQSSFIKGSFIATMGIVISKILGIIYAIPFHAIVGEKGGALYGYAYSVYAIFLGISNVGIPIAVSKMISEYDALEKYKSKEKVFRIANNILNVVGLITFIILFVFAPYIASNIIGDIKGGNTINDIVFVIRVISFSILIVPTLSIYRGYIQGHKNMTPTARSQVLEQVIRVSIIIFGGIIGSKIFHLPIRDVVAIALAGATIGALFSWIYLLFKVKEYRDNDKLSYDLEKDEDIEDTKFIIKTIALYAAPFIFADVAKPLFNSIDTFFVVKTLVNDLGYNVKVAESVMGVISTWGDKLVKIIIAIGTGFISTLIPHLAVSFVKKDYTDINKKIIQSFEVLTLLTLPMTLGLAFLAEPAWTIFYGASKLGPKVFQFYVFTAYVTVLFTLVTTILIALKEYKTFYIGVLAGLLFNYIFDRPLMLLFGRLNISFIPAYYGAILSTILGNLLTVFIGLRLLKKEYHLNMYRMVQSFVRVLISCTIMLITLKLMKIIVPLSGGRFYSLMIVFLYAIVGALVYGFTVYKMKMLKQAFGKENLVTIKNKVKKVLKK